MFQWSPRRASGELLETLVRYVKVKVKGGIVWFDILEFSRVRWILETELEVEENHVAPDDPMVGQEASDKAYLLWNYAKRFWSENHQL